MRTFEFWGILDHVVRWPDDRAAALDTIEYHKLVQRRAVLVADMSGFSSITLERGNFDALVQVARFRAAARDRIEANGGRVLKFDADDVVAVFESPAAALDAGHQLAADKTCSVGLGYGDLLVLEDDVWGAEMNAASKLGEARAKAGQVMGTPAFREAMATLSG